MRTKGSAADLEARRRLAVQRVNDGWRRKDVAAFLGVHPETVGEWVRSHAAGGTAALAAKPHPGRTPFLTPVQDRQVLGWLADPPTKHGYDAKSANPVSASNGTGFGSPSPGGSRIKSVGIGSGASHARTLSSDRPSGDNWSMLVCHVTATLRGYFITRSSYQPNTFDSPAAHRDR